MAARLATTLARLWSEFRAGRPAGAPAAAPDGARPWLAIPSCGGDWFACRTPGEAWRLSLIGTGLWHVLDERGFRAFQAQVAEAGGRMETLTIEWEGARQVEVRHRSIGHKLHGDRRDSPAIQRRSENWEEFFYFRAGNPVGHERLSRTHRARSGGRGMAAAA